MKTRTITFIAVATIATLLLGTFAFTVFAPPKQLKLKVKWKPNSVLLDTTIPDPWIAQVFFAPPEDLNQVNPSTVRLEGIYTLESTPYILTNANGRLALPFHGYDVLTALTMKLPHMTPGSYYVGLEITGNLYDGRAFAGTGYINATVPELPAP
jgi:hypothetical protein